MKHYLFCLIIGSSLIGMELAEKPRADKKSLSKLSHAVKQDYTQELTQLLESVTFTRTQKVEALITAITLRKKNGVAVLLHHGVHTNGINSRQTPLLEAVLSRQGTLVEWLLIFGADPLHTSLLSNFNDLPTTFEWEASDSAIVYISPLNLARARVESRDSTKIDKYIYKILNSIPALWEDPTLKEKVKVTSNSCIEAIKHSDTDALIEHLDQCTLTKKRKQHYLDERFTIAASMGNQKAMRLLVKAGAKAAPALLKFATSFEIEPITLCIINQYANDGEIKDAKETAESREYDVNFIPSVNNFQKKKQKTVDLLSNSRTLMLDAAAQGRNIALVLSRREQQGTT